MENNDVEIKKQNAFDHIIDIDIAKAGKFFHEKMHKPFDTKFAYSFTRSVGRLSSTFDEILEMIGRKRCTTCNGFGFINK